MRWLGLCAFLAAMGVIALAGLAPRRPDPVLEAWRRDRDRLRAIREAGGA